MTHDLSSQNVQDINPNINFDSKKTQHFKKALCQKCFKDCTNHSFKNLKELGDLINKGNFVHKYLPNKQT